MKQAVLHLPGNHDSGNDRKRITETDKENPVMSSIIFQDQIKSVSHELTRILLHLYIIKYMGPIEKIAIHLLS